MTKYGTLKEKSPQSEIGTIFYLRVWDLIKHQLLLLRQLSLSEICKNIPIQLMWYDLIKIYNPDNLLSIHQENKKSSTG